MRERRVCVSVVVAALLFLSMGAASAQGVRTVVLSAPAEFPESFSQITSPLELSDGRVLVLDTQEKALRLLDFAKGTMTDVSRLGAGPLEFRVPGMLLGGVDTVAYYDAMQHRFLLFNATATPVRTVPFGDNDISAMITQILPMGADAEGRVYGQTIGVRMAAPGAAPSPNGFTLADTIEIERLDRVTGKALSLVRIRNAAAQSPPTVQLSGTSLKMSMTAPNFTPRDAWAVFPDGRIALLKDGVYRLHVVTAGKPDQLGPEIPFTPVPVSAADQRALVDSVRAVMDKQLQTMRKAMGAAGPDGAKQFAIDIQVGEPEHWAATKPAYTSITASADGRLWVAVPQPAGEKSAALDVLDSHGARIFRVQVPPGEVVAAVGRGRVYTIRTDDDGLQYLRRYPVLASK